MNYYNEIDPKAAAWLRELIADGLIPEGHVDERSITDVCAGDLHGYTQCHFFAGIGGWSLALKLAGWPEDRPAWTGSCPCQSFSCAGKGKGFDDPRGQLWNDFMRLIRECRPERVFGEQVEAAIGHGWLDRVFADLEAESYTCGAAVLGAHSVRAPHRRQRLYWCAVADTRRSVDERRRELRASHGEDGAAESEAQQRQRSWASVGDFSPNRSALADAQHAIGRPVCGPGDDGRNGQDTGRQETHGEPGACGEVQQLAHPAQRGRRADGSAPGSAGYAEYGFAVGDSSSKGLQKQRGQPGTSRKEGGTQPRQAVERGSAPANFWSTAIWHPCRDGKARRIPKAQPGLLSLVNGLPDGMDLGWLESGFPLAQGKVEGRVSLLKGYGNAIVPQVAAEFVAAVREAIEP